tara:strand:- start:82 stop:306 length:225 start_codon:yes stop_codon:yes gene_type:complete
MHATSFSKKLFATIVFVGAIICLQLLLSVANRQFPQLQQQTELNERRNIDPAALFYTDSALALDAEKAVRASIQ